MPIEIDDMKIVRLEPDDVLVFFHPGRMSMKQVNVLDAQIGAAFPGRKFIVLQEGLSLEALRPVEDTHAKGA